MISNPTFIMTVLPLFKVTPTKINMTVYFCFGRKSFQVCSSLSSSHSLLILPAPLPHRSDKVFYLICLRYYISKITHFQELINWYFERRCCTSISIIIKLRYFSIYKPHRNWNIRRNCRNICRKWRNNLYAYLNMNKNLN